MNRRLTSERIVATAQEAYLVHQTLTNLVQSLARLCQDFDRESDRESILARIQSLTLAAIPPSIPNSLSELANFRQGHRKVLGERLRQRAKASLRQGDAYESPSSTPATYQVPGIEPDPGLDEPPDSPELRLEYEKLFGDVFKKLDLGQE